MLRTSLWVVVVATLAVPDLSGQAPQAGGQGGRSAATAATGDQVRHRKPEVHLITAGANPLVGVTPSEVKTDDLGSRFNAQVFGSSYDELSR